MAQTFFRRFYSEVEENDMDMKYNEVRSRFFSEYKTTNPITKKKSLANLNEFMLSNMYF